MSSFSLGFLSVPECSPIEAALVAARAGYGFVGIRLVPVTQNEKPYELFTSKKLQAEFRNLLRDNNVQIGDIELLRILPNSKPEDFLPLLDVAHLLEAKRIVAISEDDNLSRVADRFSVLAQWCEERDLFLELEPITWTRVRNLKAAAEILRRVGHPRLGLLVDILHFHRSGSTCEDFLALGMTAPRLIHLCDAILEFDPSPEAMKRTARECRLFPGEGQLVLEPFMRLASNETVVSIEVPNSEYRRIYTPLQRAEIALNAAKALCISAGIDQV